MSPPDPLRAPSLLSRDYTVVPPRRRRRLWPWVLAAVLVVLLTPPAAVLALRWVPPPTTAFMLQSPVQPVHYRWVPATEHPEALRAAVIAAEDQKFYTHQGFDFEAIEQALEHNRTSRRVRGASTITQQVAKNLFLWPSRSWVRKGLEVSVTVLLELLWPKERILEVYLNIAEFGSGIYGAEAAAQAFFGKGAAALAPAEAAQLAAVLPNPRKWRAANPGPYVQTRTDWILDQIGEPPRYAAVPEREEPAFSAFPGVEPAPAEPGLEPEGDGTIATQPLPDDSGAAMPDPADDPAYSDETETMDEADDPGDPALDDASPQETPAETPETEDELAP